MPVNVAAAAMAEQTVCGVLPNTLLLYWGKVATSFKHFEQDFACKIKLIPQIHYFSQLKKIHKFT